MVDVPNLAPILIPGYLPGFALRSSRAARLVRGPEDWQERAVQEEWACDKLRLRLTVRWCDNPAAAQAELPKFFSLYNMHPPFVHLNLGDACWSLPNHLAVATRHLAFDLHANFELDTVHLIAVALRVIKRLETWQPSPPPALHVECKVAWQNDQVEVEICSSVDPVTFETGLWGPQGRLKALWEDDVSHENPYLWRWDGQLDSDVPIGGTIPTAAPGLYSLLVTATDPYGRTLRQTVPIQLGR